MTDEKPPDETQTSATRSDELAEAIQRSPADEQSSRDSDSSLPDTAKTTARILEFARKGKTSAQDPATYAPNEFERMLTMMLVSAIEAMRLQNGRQRQLLDLLRRIQGGGVLIEPLKSLEDHPLYFNDLEKDFEVGDAICSAYDKIRLVIAARPPDAWNQIEQILSEHPLVFGEKPADL
jgi:hypothetical protein